MDPKGKRNDVGIFLLLCKHQTLGSERERERERERDRERDRERGNGQHCKR